MAFLTQALCLMVCFFTVCSTLYQDNGYIHVLESSNFSTFISSQPTLVQFYSRNCGGCQEYAPIFNKIARSVQNWQWLVKLAVLDCFDEANDEILKKANVESFPSFRFYHLTKPLQPFLKVWSEKELREKLVLALSNDTDVHSIFPIVSGKLAEIDLLVSGSDMIANAMIILDLHDFVSVPLKSHIDESLGRDRYSLLSSFHSPLIYNVSESQLQEYILKHYAAKNKTSTSLAPEEKPTTKKPKPVAPTLLPVYAADIFAALRHTLRLEVTRKKEIKGEDMQALKEFVKVVSLYLPLRAHINNSLEELSKKLSVYDSITSSVWLSLLRESSFPDMDAPYVGCKGSQPHFRGYPCGLWEISHAMTVRRLLLKPADNWPSVAHALNRFVPRFFSCIYCAYHFAGLTANIARSGESVFPIRDEPPPFLLTEPDKNKLLPYPNSARDEIIWLNSAHNLVNIRLAGRPSEDPDAPKIIFPAPSQCPTCWSANASKIYASQPFSVFPDVEDELIAFLIHHYRPSSWSWMGLPISYRDFASSTSDG